MSPLDTLINRVHPGPDSVFFSLCLQTVFSWLRAAAVFAIRDTAPRRKVCLCAAPGLDGSKFMLLYRKYLCFKSPHMWISREKQRTQVGWISPSHPGVRPDPAHTGTH